MSLFFDDNMQVPTRLQQGAIDLNELETLSAPFVTDWIHKRLNGEDPYISVDRDMMEVPHMLFVDIWKQALPSSNLRQTMSQACSRLLTLAWESDTGDWIRWLLRLVATITPKCCLPFLTSIAKHRNFTPALREAGLDRLWLEAAAAYPRQTPELLGYWESILERGPAEYRAIAYSALSSDLTPAVWYLPTYLQSVPLNDREVLLEEALRDILGHGYYTALQELSRLRDKLKSLPGLPDLVDALLQRIGAPPLPAAEDPKVQKLTDIALAKAA